MKKTFFLFVLIFSSIPICAQSVVEATIVKKQGDTVKTNVKVRKDLLKKTIDPLSFDGLVFLQKGNKKRGKIKEADIKYMEFIDYSEKKRVFVSNLEVPELEINKNLYEQKYKGKISWYKDYFPVVVDQMKSMGSKDYFLKEGHKLVGVKIFAGNYKKYLKELVDNDRELSELIDDIQSENDIIDVLKSYNEKHPIPHPTSL